MVARNEIADLFEVGRELTLSNRGRSVKVWVQKLTPVEHAKATKKAFAAQARVLSVLRDRDSDEYYTYVAQALEMDAEQAAQRVLRRDRLRVSFAEEAKLAEEDEWAKDGYLEGLRNAWGDGLQQTYKEDPDDPEAARVFTELTRFNKAVAAAVDAEMADRTAARLKDPLEVLHDEVVPVVVREAATNEWVMEFHRCKVWLGTRVCTHSTHERPVLHRDLYFESRAEIDVLPGEAFDQLDAAIGALEVDALEGKDSEETPDSSDLSGSPETPETGVSSGLVAASA